MEMRECSFLAISFNSMIIEISEDKFRISYGFTACQLLTFIGAVTVTRF